MLRISRVNASATHRAPDGAPLDLLIGERPSDRLIADCLKHGVKLIVADAPAERATQVAEEGGRPIAEALFGGAAIVVSREFDHPSALVALGMWHFGWTHPDVDQLAGATIAGLIVANARFPHLELFKDGRALITTYPGTGRRVTVEAIHDEVLDDLSGDELHQGRDVNVRLDTVRLMEEAADRVRVFDCRGVMR